MSLKPIVCDNGTGYVKVGYAGENFPAHIFPSMVGRPLMRFEEEFKDVELKDIMVGDEVAEHRSMLECSYPVENGIVRNWDDMKHLWDHTWNVRPAVRRCVVLCCCICVILLLSCVCPSTCSAVFTPTRVSL